MKKICIALILMFLCLTGCANSTTVGGNGSTWDCVEYETIEEMNEAAGTNIVSAAVAGKSDEWFGVISDSIAQYTFKVNGQDWCIRASKDVDNDISGLNYDSITFEKDITATYYTDEVYAFRFFYDDTQYVISLNVKDNDFAMSEFDSICSEFKTNITGVKSGYDNELYEDGDNVVYKLVLYNDDGTTTVMETVYGFDGDKMVSITSNIIFETEEAAKEYYDMLIESGKTADELVLNQTIITSDMSQNLDFYSDVTKAEFISQMESSLQQ